MGLPSSSLNQSTSDTLSVLVGGDISQGSLGCGSKQIQNLIFATIIHCTEFKARGSLFYLCDRCWSVSPPLSKAKETHFLPKPFLHLKHKKWFEPPYHEIRVFNESESWQRNGGEIRARAPQPVHMNPLHQK